MRASPSALKRFDCPRRWAFSRFAKFPREDKPWFAFGRVVDQMGEKYLKTGERPLGDTHEGSVFLRMLPFLPKPGLAQTQVPLTFAFDGHQIAGFADLVYSEDHPIPVVLGDLKTFGNRNFILNEKSIHLDPQVIGYSGALCQALDQSKIRVRWTYGDKRAERAHPVDAIIDQKVNLSIARKKFLPVLDSMDQLCKAPPSTVAEINEVPNDPSQCDGCGKNCDYAVHCNLYPRKTIIMAETIQERIDRLKKGGSGAGGNPGTETAKALEETKKEIATGSIDDPVKALEAQLAKAKADAEVKAKADAEAAAPKDEPKPKGGRKAKAAVADVLGKVAMDPYTKFAGTVTYRRESVDGLIELFVEPESPDGKAYGRWFNEGRLTIE